MIKTCLKIILFGGGVNYIIQRLLGISGLPWRQFILLLLVLAVISRLSKFRLKKNLAILNFITLSFLFNLRWSTFDINVLVFYSWLLLFLIGQNIITSIQNVFKNKTIFIIIIVSVFIDPFIGLSVYSGGIYSLHDVSVLETYKAGGLLGASNVLAIYFLASSKFLSFSALEFIAILTIAYLSGSRWFLLVVIAVSLGRYMKSRMKMLIVVGGALMLYSFLGGPNVDLSEPGNFRRLANYKIFWDNFSLTDFSAGLTKSLELGTEHFESTVLWLMFEHGPIGILFLLALGHTLYINNSYYRAVLTFITLLLVPLQESYIACLSILVLINNVNEPFNNHSSLRGPIGFKTYGNKHSVIT